MSRIRWIRQCWCNDPHCLEACDTLLMLGTDFPYRQFFPKDARVAQIDIRAEAIGRRAPVELGLVGHANSARTT
jgi:pyruvate dehydrogenase (quinone)